MMKGKTFALILAASFAGSALVGCATPAAVAPEMRAGAGAEAREGAASALADEQDMDDYEYFAAQAGAAKAYTVFVVGQPAPAEGEMAITGTVDGEADPGSVEAGEDGDHHVTGSPQGGKGAFKGKLQADVRAKLEARMQKKAEKLAARLAKKKDARDAIKAAHDKAPWADNGDGTETQTMTFRVANGGVTREVAMTRTRNKETRDLIASESRMTSTQASGMSRTVERTKTLNADGTYAVTFHSEHGFKDGRKRVADWTKTIGVDGAVTGAGTMSWFDAQGAETKKTTVTLNGSDEDTRAAAEGEVVAAATEA